MQLLILLEHTLLLILLERSLLLFLNALLLLLLHHALLVLLLSPLLKYLLLLLALPVIVLWHALLLLLNARLRLGTRSRLRTLLVVSSVILRIDQRGHADRGCTHQQRRRHRLKNVYFHFS